MKNVKIGYFEVEVKAKMLNETRNSKESLLYFLNELCIVYGEAAKYNKERQSNAFYKDFDEKSKALYELLTELGAYD